jgi:ABC-type dipeptide/oligopeptide/nickel transport system permease component
MSNVETARKNYEVAHHQLIARVHMRDNVLLVYLTAIGTIFSVALSIIFGAKSTNDEIKKILLTIPYLALGCSVIVSNHNIIIGALLNFCSMEIRPFLQNITPSEYAPQFDTSEYFEKSRILTLCFRTLGHGIILLTPCIVALYLNWKGSSLFSQELLWWLAAGCTLFTLIIIIITFIIRKKWQKEQNQKFVFYYLVY